MTDFSKAFGSIPYDMLVAKLNANGFDQEVLKLDRSQKVGSSFSKELDILCYVPQGSVLGLLLPNIDIYDLFFTDTSADIANYADDTTPYECAP